MRKLWAHRDLWGSLLFVAGVMLFAAGFGRIEAGPVAQSLTWLGLGFTLASLLVLYGWPWLARRRS